jgi:hypothetical protein
MPLYNIVVKIANNISYKITSNMFFEHSYL